MKLEWYGIKVNGSDFKLSNPVAFRDECNKLTPGRYKITVEKKRNNKSQLQLGYLFANVYPVSQKLLLDAGWELATIDEVDAFWKAKFADKEIVNRHSGEIMNVPGLKRHFTTTEMMAYIDAIRNYCAEYLGGYIPEPESQLKIEI